MRSKIAANYPFACVVERREPLDGRYMSIEMLIQLGAKEALITALVHGPEERAIELMAEFNNKYVVKPNPNRVGL